MAARKSGLGRGLDALIPVDRPQEGFAQIPLDRISPNPNQPRSRFSEDALAELAASIREVGVLQPVVVHPDEDEGRYVLIAGERRWRAASQAGLTDIPAMIRSESDTDHTTLTEALIENVQREDLSPLEEAAAYQQLMDDFSLTHEQIAGRVGKSRSTITNTLRLLQLPAEVQGLLESGAVSAGHARALLGLDDQAYAVHIAERSAGEGWSVRQVEDAVRARQGGEATPTRTPRPKEPRPAAIIELESRLSERLGSKVTIDYGSKGGKLVVRFSDLDDLEKIYKAFFG